MAFQGSDAFYSAVELAFQATGVQSLHDADAALQALNAKIAASQAAFRAGTISLDEFSKQALELSRDADIAAERVNALTRVALGLPAQVARVGTASSAASRGVLELSRGLEDLTTGGYLGILNNIPGIFQSFGQAAGLAAPHVALLTAGASALGTAGYLVYTHWDKIKELFADPLAPTAIESVESLTAALKELTEKEWKTRIDVRDIEIAEEKLAELKRAKAGFDKLDAATEAEQARGKAVVSAVVENAGKGGRKAVVDATLAATAGPESPEVAEARKKIEELDRKIKQAEEMGNEEAANLYASQRRDLATSKEGRQATEMQNRRKAIEDMLGKAAAGDESQLKWLRDVVARNPNKFQAYGVAPGFGAALDEAAAAKTPAQVKAERAAESARKHAETEAESFDTHAETIHGQAVAKAVTAVGPGHDEDLQKRIFDAIKAGATPEDAMAGRREELAGKLSGRVPEAVLGQVVDVLLRKAADAAENLIAEGKNPTLDVRAAAEKKKGDAATDKAVNEATKLYEPGYKEGLDRYVQDKRASGLSADQIHDKLLPQVIARLKANGLDDAALRPKVAHAIITRANDRTSQRIEAARQAGAPTDRAAAATLTTPGQAREAAKLDDPFVEPLQLRIAANRRAQVVGDPTAVRERDLARELQAEVGSTLRASGQDPKLAQKVVADAFREANTRYANMFARTGSQVDALMGIMNVSFAKLEQQQRQIDARGAGILHLNNQARRSAQNRGPLLPAMGPGFN